MKTLGYILLTLFGLILVFYKIYKIKSLWLKLLLVGILMLGSVGAYRYFNRLEKKDEISVGDDLFEMYIDWSKSSNYWTKNRSQDYSINCSPNYFFITKNKKVFFKIKDWSPAEDWSFPMFDEIKNDSFYLYKRTGDYLTYLRIPIHKDRVYIKDTKLIIYTDDLKEGIIKDTIKTWRVYYRKEITPDSAKLLDMYRDY